MPSISIDGQTDDLVAGKPYVFRATSDEIKVIYYPETQVDNEVYTDNHLYGSFDGQFMIVRDGKTYNAQGVYR